VTVLEAIQRSTEFLSRKGVESPRLQTELLLAHLLKQPRMRLYLEFERVLAPVEVDGFRELIKRRGQREPLQHIVGSTSFCGLEITVNRHVLIPRPETELLAERGWTFLNQLSTLNPEPSTALDFGTGSGCLAIALASKCPAVEVYALDVSAEALAQARQNAERHRVAERIRFLQGDGFAAAPAGVRFDLIISNPPYIPSEEIASLQPEVRDFDPRRALDGGADGLDYGRRLAAESAQFLKPLGRLMLEFGDGQAERLRAFLEERDWVVEAVEQDYTRRPRLLVARRSNSAAPEPRAAGPQPDPDRTEERHPAEERNNSCPLA
jgi:release factor glutamine methyltransferase